MIILVHPAQEGGAVGCQRNTINRVDISNGHGGGAVDIRRSTCHSRGHRTVGSGVFHGHGKCLLCAGEGHVGNHQRVFGTIRLGGDNNGKTFTSFQCLRIAGFAFNILSRIFARCIANFDGIDISLCHIKGDCAFFTGIIGDVNGHGCGFGITATLTGNSSSNFATGLRQAATTIFELYATNSSSCVRHSTVSCLCHFTVADAQLGVDFVSQNVLLFFAQQCCLFGKLILLGQGCLSSLVTGMIAVSIEQHHVGHVGGNTQLLNVCSDLCAQRNQSLALTGLCGSFCRSFRGSLSRSLSRFFHGGFRRSLGRSLRRFICGGLGRSFRRSLGRSLYRVGNRTCFFAGMVMAIICEYLRRYCREDHDHCQTEGQYAFSILCDHNNSS